MARRRTRINKSGYKEDLDPRTGEWVPRHRAVAEAKFGRLRAGFDVHHRDGNKWNNRRSNLLEVHKKVHGRMHSTDPDACARCGRSGHWSGTCRARTFYDGTPIRD